MLPPWKPCSLKSFPPLFIIFPFFSSSPFQLLFSSDKKNVDCHPHWIAYNWPADGSWNNHSLYMLRRRHYKHRLHRYTQKIFTTTVDVKSYLIDVFVDLGKVRKKICRNKNNRNRLLSYKFLDLNPFKTPKPPSHSVNDSRSIPLHNSRRCDQISLSSRADHWTPTVLGRPGWLVYRPVFLSNVSAFFQV